MIMTNPEIKPREFWIEIGNECDDIVWQSPVNENAIHVIEYSAYEALQAKLAKAIEALKQIDKDCCRHDTTAWKIACDAIEQLEGEE